MPPTDAPDDSDIAERSAVVDGTVNRTTLSDVLQDPPPDPEDAFGLAAKLAEAAEERAEDVEALVERKVLLAQTEETGLEDDPVVADLRERVDRVARARGRDSSPRGNCLPASVASNRMTDPRL
jgi:hypothetical protein